MTTCAAVLKKLEKLGSPSTKRIYLTHGMKEPLFGVKVADMKALLKEHRGDHDLAMELFASGNADAMYFAALLAEPSRMSKRHLEGWARSANGNWIVEYSVPWVAAESAHGWELGTKWIDAKDEKLAACGWAALGSLVGLRADDELDVAALEKLLARVEREIHEAPNRVKYTMNGFVVAVGCFVKPLHEKAAAAAKRIGAVTVDMNGTACKVPLAADTIAKVKSAGRIGKKRKSARC